MRSKNKKTKAQIPSFIIYKASNSFTTTAAAWWGTDCLWQLVRVKKKKKKTDTNFFSFQTRDLKKKEENDLFSFAVEECKQSRKKEEEEPHGEFLFYKHEQRAWHHNNSQANGAERHV